MFKPSRKLLFLVGLVVLLQALTLVPQAYCGNGPPEKYVNGNLANPSSWQLYSGNPVFPTGGWATRPEHPTPVRWNNQWILFFENYVSGHYGIGYATSTDLIHWVENPTDPIFTGTGVSGTFDEYGVGNPCFMQIDSTYWYMWYGGHDSTGAIWEIGCARTTVSAFPKGWTRVQSTPVVPRGASGKFDDFIVAVPSVIRLADGTFYMIYEGWAGPTYWGACNEGIASSTDGVHWTKLNNGDPVIRTTQGAWDSYRNSNGQIYYNASRYEVYYAGESTGQGQGQGGLGMAYSTDLIHWTKYSGNPIIRPSQLWGVNYCNSPYPIQSDTGTLYLYFIGGNSGGGDFKCGFATASGSTPPLTGTLRVFASYQESYVSMAVTVAGPSIFTGTTTLDPGLPLTFSLGPATYTVSATYAGTLKSEQAVVMASETVDVTLNFGGSPPPPPPSLPWIQIAFVGGAISVVGVLVYVAKRKAPHKLRRTSRKHFSIRRKS